MVCTVGFEPTKFPAPKAGGLTRLAHAQILFPIGFDLINHFAAIFAVKVLMMCWTHRDEVIRTIIRVILIVMVDLNDLRLPTYNTLLPVICEANRAIPVISLRFVPNGLKVSVRTCMRTCPFALLVVLDRIITNYTPAHIGRVQVAEGLVLLNI